MQPSYSKKGKPLELFDVIENRLTTKPDTADSPESFSSLWVEDAKLSLPPDINDASDSSFI
jgi:hypothetical protein